MCDYMYQYRSNVERMVLNVGRDKAWSYVKGLYDSGLIDIKEWNTLSEYSKEYRRAYEREKL